jgi:hypothetical protein
MMNNKRTVRGNKLTGLWDSVMHDNWFRIQISEFYEILVFFELGKCCIDKLYIIILHLLKRQLFNGHLRFEFKFMLIHRFFRSFA